MVEMGESRTTLTTVFGVLYPFIDGHTELHEVRFCLKMFICESQCLPGKLYMKLCFEVKEAEADIVG